MPKTTPEELIAEARKCAKKKDFYTAERMCVNALTNARGTSKEATITRAVKTELCNIYIEWGKHCVSNYDFQDAEPIILKWLKLADDKVTVKKELKSVYRLWSGWLKNDGNYSGAILVKIKEIKLSIELNGNVMPFELSELCELKYATGNKVDTKLADQLFLSLDHNRMCIKLQAVVFALLALVTPFFAPFSIFVYIFYYLFNMIDMEMDRLKGREGKRIKKSLKITFGSIVWLLIMVIFASDGSLVASIISFAIILALSIMNMKDAIKRVKLLGGYSGKSTSMIIDYIEKNTMTSGIEFRVKNKPEKQDRAKVTWGADKTAMQGGLNRAAGAAAHMLVKEILRNIRF